MSVSCFTLSRALSHAHTHKHTFEMRVQAIFDAADFRERLDLVDVVFDEGGELEKREAGDVGVNEEGASVLKVAANPAQ